MRVSSAVRQWNNGQAGLIRQWTDCSLSGRVGRAEICQLSHLIQGIGRLLDHGRTEGVIDAAFDPGPFIVGDMALDLVRTE